MNVLTYNEAKGILNWCEAVEALRLGHQRPKAQMHDVLMGPAGGRLLNRMAHIEGMGYGVKAESIFPENTHIGLPATHGAVLVYDCDHGILRGVIDSHIITDLKTAADSVLGATMLARPDSKHLVIIGAGRVAANLAQAYYALFPALEKITIWARRTAQAEQLTRQLEHLPIPVMVGNDLAMALATADIVSSATMAQQPILLGKWLRSGTHVDLIGAFTVEMREADDELIAAASLYVDSHETTRHIGEIAIPMAAGIIPSGHVQGDLYDLIKHDKPDLSIQSGITVFKNGGGAHLDLMIADCMLRKMGL